MTTLAPSTDLDFYSEEVILNPYDTYRRLRDTAPAVWLERYQVWAVTRYDDVYAALHDHRTFASGYGVALNDPLNEKMKGSALVSDPPYHDHVRGVMGGPLTPRALRKHHDYFQERADALIDHLLELGRFDGVRDFAQIFPLSVVPDLLGWPAEGREHFLDWASAGFQALGPMNERALRDLPTLKGMWEYMAEIVRPGRLAPGSWGAALVEAAEKGEVDKQLLPALIGDYLVPSLDTTVSALSTMLWQLGENPDQWRMVREDPSLIPNVLNESIRYEAPSAPCPDTSPKTPRSAASPSPAAAGHSWSTPQLTGTNATGKTPTPSTSPAATPTPTSGSATASTDASDKDWPASKATPSSTPSCAKSPASKWDSPRGGSTTRFAP